MKPHLFLELLLAGAIACSPTEPMLRDKISLTPSSHHQYRPLPR